jgi:hypothetical protein
MKILVPVTLIAAVFIGCSGVKIQQHNLPCHTRTKADVLRSAMSLLVQHGFKITVADTVLGLVQAETEETRDIWSGMISKRVWQVSIRPELGPLGQIDPVGQAALSKPQTDRTMYVIATARTVNKTTNAFGATISTAEIYYDDSVHEDWEWYWEVRRGLESVCGSKVVISTRKVN